MVQKNAQKWFQKSPKRVQKVPENGSKALENGFCKKHQSATIKQMATLGKKLTQPQKEKTIPKTKLEIAEWLATAIPEKVTTLKKHSLGFIHEETEIIFKEFEDSYIAIGVANNGKLDPLTKLETDKCEYMGWRYDYESVENIEADESDSDTDNSDTESSS